jgi:hypothetical protein
MGNSDSLAKLVKDIKAAQEKAKSGRKVSDYNIFL